MKLSVISFTEQGNQWNIRLTERFPELGHNCMGYVMPRFMESDLVRKSLKPLDGNLEEWTKKQFDTVDGLIFIGAVGIAVRAVAPFIKDKLTDPAVVVLDESGRFAISLLSGHVGGANDLALLVSEITGAQPVITTATDVRGRFAVDLFAKRLGLLLTDRVLAKKISADVLEGRPVGLFSDYPLTGRMPEGLTEENGCDRNVKITCHQKTGAEEGVLKLIPRIMVLGIGCRKGTERDTIKRQVDMVLAQADICSEAIRKIASIDIKSEEPGLLAYGQELGAEMVFYDAETLAEVPGEYTTSEFVAETTGVGNVCERAAMAHVLSCGGGRLLVKKQAGDGVTVAVAELDWKVEL